VTIDENAWAGATANVYVVKYVLEKNLGCKVNIEKLPESTPLFQAMADGKVDVLLEDGFLARVEELAKRLRHQLDQLAAAYPGVIQGVRGQGLLLGLVVGPPNTEISSKLMARGLLTVPAGDNVVRLLPPLIIGQAEIDEALAILEELCQELAGQEAAQ